MSERANQQDASAEFIRCLTASQRKLYAFIRSLVRRPSDADDVLQETNMVMWQKCGEFKEGSNFEAWAFRIARYQIMAYRKRQQRSKLHFNDELIEQLADHAAEMAQDHEPRREALSQCLAKLPEPQRRLIAARYEPGARVSELAAKQGRSPKALSEALRRIRGALLTCIESRLNKGAAS
ncbi:MAG: sigma-70 family RNA polymerase sigma factor [Verrucomicrobiota bacterium]